MDWNNDGKYDWQDSAMDMYLMDQIDSDNKNSTTNKTTYSTSSSFGVLVWFAVIIITAILLAIFNNLGS